ncbi:MAG TPA: hypothetical protein VHF25_12250 [Nitriliruptorales bacterium]|nr:hypothetical protein [Nitriliruptorales bacterium]
MADPPRPPHSRGGADPEPDWEPAVGAPRWVKVFGIIGIVALALIVVMLVVGGGAHGPRRHLPGGDTSGIEVPGSDHRPPAAGHLPAG